MKKSQEKPVNIEEKLLEKQRIRLLMSERKKLRYSDILENYSRIKKTQVFY